MNPAKTASKKRPAPGTTSPQQRPAPNTGRQDSSNPSDISQMSNDQFLAWGSPTNTLPYTDSNNAFGNENDMTRQRQPIPSTAQPSNQLVRRNQDPYLIDKPLDQSLWQKQAPETSSAPWVHEKDDRDLKKRALRAREEAIAKKKQIPPFIQKLSSFLDNNSNTDLIRWSDSGDSFVVLDEEQFASKLIPELFKHNNYASFVRQLNMYGFHKKVGLSDNSMRASEKKSRTPSEYENPYFKRGRPELLWLIGKPRPQGPVTKKKARRGSDGDQDSDDDDGRDLGEASLDGTGRNLDLVTLPRTQLQSFQREIDQLKKSQHQINSMIARFQHENTQYIRQASAQHERHENSINAILTFLATFYSRSVEGNGNPQMFPGAIPQAQPQGNVVEEYDDTTSSEKQLQRAPRHRLALPAPDSTKQKSRSVTPDAQSTPLQQSESPQIPPSQLLQDRGALRNGDSQGGSSANATPVVQDDAQNKQANLSLNAVPNSNTNPAANDIMTVINSVNASTPPATAANFDISSALRNYENSGGNAPLTPEQRDNVLSLMANTSGTKSPITASSSAANVPPDTPRALLGQYNANKETLEAVHRLQSEQNSKLQDLGERLQPLSPNGSIPGLDMDFGGNTIFNQPSSLPMYNNNNNYNGGGKDANGAASDLDLNNFLNSDYFQDFSGNDLSNTAAGSNADFTANNPFGGDGGAGFADFEFGNGGVDTGTFTGFPENDAGNLEGNGDGAAQQQVKAPEPEFEDEGAGVGRIVGSVGTSSGTRTPTGAKAGDDEEEEGDGGPGSRKRRKVGG